jgi:hypothetical protein
MTELCRNPHDFHGEQRANHTDQSTTDPDSRLFKKAKRCEAKLAHLGGALMKNPHCPGRRRCAVAAAGTREREATSLVAVCRAGASASARPRPTT